MSAADHRAGGSSAVLDPAPGPSQPRRPRRLLLTLGAAAVAVGVAVTVVVVGSPSERAPLSLPPDSRVSPPADWLSGAAGDQVGLQDFGAWRGRPVEVAGTWSDNNDAMVELSELRPGGGFDAWEAPLDIAVGAIGEDETWAEAAAGAYDARWRQSLSNLRELRADRAGTTFIRFAHEMNGNWYDWSVDSDDADSFVEAWRRYRALQQEVFPDARLVFGTNRESVETGMDWREFFPGAEYVDAIGVDYYNRSPDVESAEDWADSLDDTDDWGAPQGLEAYRAFAEEVGLPLAVPEWSGSADDGGDSPAFIEGMYDFFETHAGDGPGQLLYEIQFNIPKDDDNWALYDPDTRMPESAATYQALW